MLTPLQLTRNLLLVVVTLWSTAYGARALAGIAPSTPEPAPRPFSPEQQRSDFATLYRRLQDSHFDLFARRPKTEYDALFEQMRGEFDEPGGVDDIQRRFQRFVAFGNVAHANIAPSAGAWEQYRAKGGKAFPLFLRVVDGKVHVVDDYSGHASIAVGDQIVSVNGESALPWMARLRAQVSADNDYLAFVQLEGQLPILVWREYGELDAFELVLAKAGGEQLAIKLPALDRAGFKATAARRSERFDFDGNTREARMLDGGIAYLRPGPFYDTRPEAAHPWDPAAFKTFVDNAFAGFLDKRAHSVLIDLRNNPGGDNSFSDPLLAWFADKPFRFSSDFEIRVSEAAVASNRKRLAAQSEGDSVSAKLAAAYAGQPLHSRVKFPIPLVSPRAGERFKGRVYLLINRHSYSNTVLVAAIAQDYGFGTVLGEETADLASTYGASEQFTLPQTGIAVSFPKARILRPSGDQQARGVVPDIAIDTPLTASSKDVVLENAVAVVSGQASATSTR